MRELDTTFVLLIAGLLAMCAVARRRIFSI
jgi:hypothetical protein